MEKIENYVERAIEHALAQDKTGPLEKKDLKVGFIPITCATPTFLHYKEH